MTYYYFFCFLAKQIIVIKGFRHFKCYGPHRKRVRKKDGGDYVSFRNAWWLVSGDLINNTISTNYKANHGRGNKWFYSDKWEQKYLTPKEILKININF